MTDQAGILESRVQAAQPNILTGILLGLVASALCCLLWYGWVVLTHMVWVFAAILFGAAVGGAVRLGAGNGTSLLLQWISAILTLLAMLMSEYLIVRHEAVTLLAKEGITQIPLFLPIDRMVELIWAGVKSTPLMPLFWGLSAVLAAAIPAKDFPNNLSAQRRR